MYEAKTKPTKASVASYLAAIDDPERRRDCKALAALMRRVTGCRATMWGSGIVGFDRYHYRYASGHEGDSCVVGFASGKAHISVYLLAGFESDEMRALLATLGRHKLGKACLYINRLSDVDGDVLEELCRASLDHMAQIYP